MHEAAAVPADPGPPPSDGPGGGDSLFKNAYFLMLSTGVSAVLGLGFWLVAARYYSEEAVGQGSAAIAAMRLLAGITATTMIGAVVRFVPRAGHATGTLVRRVYAASSVVVAVAAVVFLLTLDRWGASYAPLGTLGAGALFVAACVAWALLTLQDGVLTGLRRAEWVPAGNAVFSVGKLVLLAVLAGTLPVLGIFVSWAVAIAFSTVPLGWLVFRRLIPRQAAADRDVRPPAVREMGRFLAGDSLGALFSLAMINLLPVMVAVHFGAAENGYFYVAYTVGGTMEFMAINMASSLTAHASHDPRRLADGVRGALRRMTLLLVPVVALLVAFAPQILLPFDEDYAEHGSTVLRLLALGALPRVVVELYIGVLRVQGRTGVLAAVQGTMCVLVLGGAAMLFTPAGIAGAGWAVLVSMTVVAVGCAPGLRAALRGPDDAGGKGPRTAGNRRRGRRAPAATGPEYGTRWARLNATAGHDADRAGRPAHGHEGTPTGDAAEGGAGDTGRTDAGRTDTGRTDTGTTASGTTEAGVRERRLRGTLWYLLAAATAVFWAALRGLPWLDAASGTPGMSGPPGPSGGSGSPGAGLTGRRLLAEVPWPALVAGGLLLLVFVASVTLCTTRDAWLPGAALGSVTLALYTAPVALGWQPREGGGAEPLLRWVPQAALLLCLAPLGLLLRRAAGRLTWPGCWGVLYVAAVAAWVWRQALAPAALPLLVVLVVAALLALPLPRLSSLSSLPVNGRGRAGGSSRSAPPRGNRRAPGRR